MENKNFFDKFAAVMDQNIKGVEYGVYAVAGLGFCVAMRSVRPFKKFYTATDIPKHFIEKKMRFSGKILKIQAGKTPTLFVDHFPVLSFPLMGRQSSGLPLQISSVEVTPNGTIWLSSLLKDSNVNFIPLKPNGQAVESIVYRGVNTRLELITVGNNATIPNQVFIISWPRQDIGQHLVTIGFATVSPWDFSLGKDRVYSAYYKSLIASERKAEKKGAGIWLDQQKVSVVRKINNIFSRLRYSLA